MSLIKCKECGNNISKKAKACPSCGAPRASRGCLSSVFYLLLFLMVTGIIASIVSDNNTKQVQTKRIEEQNNKIAAEKVRLASLTPEEKAKEENRKVQQELLAKQKQIEEKRKREEEARKAEEAKRYNLGLIWRYDDRTDDISGKISNRAWIRSKNQIEFDFPYTGLQRATLVIRKHPRFGTDVILKIDKGQFLCRSRDCDVILRFDEKTANRQPMLEPEDASSETLFFENKTHVIRNLKSHSTLLIEATFYDEGSKVFEFDIGGLNWN